MIMMLTPGCEGGTFLRVEKNTNPDETFQVTKLGGYLVRLMYKFFVYLFFEMSYFLILSSCLE